MNKITYSQIAKNVNELVFSNGDIVYLIGTAHVAKESVSLVSDYIIEKKPDTVFIELDEQRLDALVNKKKFEDLDLVKIIREKKLLFVISQFLLSSYQKKISQKTGSKPGSEFKAAFELAQQHQSKVVLMDRRIDISLKRTWRLMRIKDKLNSFFSMLFYNEKDMEISEENLSEILEKDNINELIEQLSGSLPILKTVLIDERDQYMAKEISSHRGKISVAVIGAGHSSGIIHNLETGTDQLDKANLDFIPSPSLWGKLIKWLIPLAIISLFIWGFFWGDRANMVDAFAIWVIVNGTLSALGCLIALAHPLTILAGFIAAPITSLNPTIGAGFVTAIVQTFLAKPRVKDFSELQENSLGMRDWWSNRVTKIFLVFLLSSIGSALGTWIAIPMLSRLF